MGEGTVSGEGNPPNGQHSAATNEELRAALIFWVDRCRRFEEKLDQFGYMKARGVTRPEFALGNRVFEESLPTIEEAQRAMRSAR